MDRERELPPVEGRPPATSDEAEGEAHAPNPDRTNANPPRTSDGTLTTPKFGSAGSGGAELEPGSERD